MDDNLLILFTLYAVQPLASRLANIRLPKLAKLDNVPIYYTFYTVTAVTWSSTHFFNLTDVWFSLGHNMLEILVNLSHVVKYFHHLSVHSLLQ